MPSLESDRYLIFVPLCYAIIARSFLKLLLLLLIPSCHLVHLHFPAEIGNVAQFSYSGCQKAAAAGPSRNIFWCLRRQRRALAVAWGRNLVWISDFPLLLLCMLLQPKSHLLLRFEMRNGIKFKQKWRVSRWPHKMWIVYFIVSKMIPSNVQNY